ncbi:MAG: sigma-E factor negative regulatory protein [Burkholderiales bacterium]
MNEKLSLLMDSEAEKADFSALLDLLKNDAHAREQWTTMQLIGDAARGLVVADDGFSIRIIKKLNKVQIEPDYDPLADSADA